MTNKIFVITQLLAVASLARIVTDGIWTGHDWYNDTFGIGNKNG